VTETVVVLLGVGLAASVAATLGLALALRRERAPRRAAEAAQAACRNEAAEQAARLALLDRRSAALAPIDALWLAWTGECRPDSALLAEAARGAAEARLLFAAEVVAEIDEVAGLLVEQLRGQSLQRAAVAAGRYEERAGLIDEEIAREQHLRPRIGALRQRLAEAARLN
jgi:pantoate kinase